MLILAVKQFKIVIYDMLGALRWASLASCRVLLDKAVLQFWLVDGRQLSTK